MRVVGVIDLRDGAAVHAQGGARRAYRPVATAAGQRIDGDAGRLAHVYIEHLGLRDLYVADLDAIGGGAVQDAALRRVARLGVRLWVDAGATSAVSARRLRDLGATDVVIGLETLPSWDAFAAICGDLGAEHAAFGLDLRDGVPVAAAASLARTGPEALAGMAAAAGAGSLLVIDLARVGAARGFDLDLLGRIRAAAPGVLLLAGGGARHAEDVRRLRACGCDGVLAATALIDGIPLV